MGAIGCRSRGSGNPASFHQSHWIPAFVEGSSFPRKREPSVVAPKSLDPRFHGDDASVSDRCDASRLALGQTRHFFFAASAASRAVSFSYDALSKLPPEPLATSRTTAHVVL